MAFNIDATILAAEFRGREEGTGKTSKKPFVLMRFETQSGRNFEVSTSDDDLMVSARALKKGDVCNLKCRMVSSPKYSMVQLIAPPQIVTSDDDEIGF